MTKPFSKPAEIFSSAEPVDCYTCPPEPTSAWACAQGVSAMDIVVETKLAHDRLADWPDFGPGSRRNLSRLGASFGDR